MAKAKPEAVRAHLYLSGVQPGHGPRRERRAQPAEARARRQWGGEPKRLRRDCKTRARRARPLETGTRHRRRGQDRDRLPATRGCGMSIRLHSAATELNESELSLPGAILVQ